jgi:beta-lactamase class A
VALVSIASPIEYIRTYTRSQAGLQALLNDLVAGKDMSIKYVDLTSGWSAGANANKESFMASTYKLFVVYSVLRRVDAGTMHMNDDVIGFSLDTCLHKIIIDSNNECSIALAEKIGWTVVQNEGRALGASGLNWSETINGTVSDAAVIPLKLARGEILSPASRTYLLDLMKAQRFRSGIPAGTPYAVADKVGFYEGWLNDTGIVYAGATPYVLAIYSNGQSWNTIADTTRRIEQLML